MKLKMYNLAILALVLFFCVSFLSAQTGDPAHHATLPLNCASCHSCEEPTYENPCLNCCPDFRREGASVYHSADEAPDTIYIDTLSQLYGPSVFSHKVHAEMAEMSGGCASCHHFNPPGDILPCSECHSADKIRTDLSKPGLKGAYHRQCQGCHQEWSNEIECLSCHAYKGTQADEKSLSLKKLNLEPIKEPLKRIYDTEYEELPVVTFYHEQHIALYGHNCVDCHQNQSCASCHNRDKNVSAEHEMHENCIGCHEAAIDENCEKCHGLEEKPPFKHNKTGFPLKAYHQNNACSACHGSSGKFSGLSKRCSSCHKGWEPDSFNHDVTGFTLDENHTEMPCEGCHQDLNYTAKPGCGMCHDEMSYPKDKPGRKL